VHQSLALDWRALDMAEVYDVDEDGEFVAGTVEQIRGGSIDFFIFVYNTRMH
jgi:hypothetical protein